VELKEDILDIETLQKFCCKDAEKYLLQHPFTQDGITWATNGWVAIGVPALADVPVNDLAPNMAKIKPATEPAEWFEIPAIDVHSCSVCHGEINEFECPECRGSGAVTLKNDWSVYEGIECCQCEGRGTVQICRYCSGTGVDSTGLLRVGSTQFKQNALWFIKDLPGIRIAPTGEAAVAWLKFDGGGIGYLMPAKERSNPPPVG
jgi:hypothetical protein